MDTKKLGHLTTSNANFVRICRYYAVEIITQARDTNTEDPHYHALIAWPVAGTPDRPRKKPAVGAFYRSVRRVTRCDHCRHWRNSTRCPICHTWFKIKWIEGYDTQYIENVYHYIKRKPNSQTTYTLETILGGSEHERQEENQTRPSGESNAE